jgi:hypothetical protein
MSQELIVNWLHRLSETVKHRDLVGHMALVSSRVQVYGVPGRDVIDYKGWMTRRRNEFDNKLLTGLRYDNLQIKTIALRHLGFSVTETMQAREGSWIIIDKDIILEQEDDGEWRVIEETIRRWNPA